MKKLIFILTFVFFIGISFGVKADRDLQVVVTTTLIGSIVQEVGGEKIKLNVLIPAGMCPGHFAISPGDLKGLEQAELVLKHGFEGENLFDKLFAKLGEDKAEVATLNLKGNWMVPSLYVRAVDRITEILSENFSDYEVFYKNKSLYYKNKVNEIVEWIKKEKGDNFSGVKVVCSRLQKPFLEWCGFNVVASYGRSESISIEEYKKLIELSKRESIKLVVDNLQSGSKVGIPIAEELRIPHVILTNFPRKKGDKFSYLESLKNNIDKLSGNLRK